MTRTDARELIMKTFYQMDLRNDFSKLMGMKCTDTVNKSGQEEYCNQLIDFVIEHRQDIDGKIAKYTVGWQIDRMPKTDLAILRLAACEIMYMCENVPVAVSINEAVDLAKKYGTENSPSFVNAILGKIEQDIRSNEQ